MANLDPRVSVLMPKLRPSTLAAIAADMDNAFTDSGDPLDDLLAFWAVDALRDIVGPEQAAKMTESALEALP